MLTLEMSSNLDIAASYIRAIEGGATGSALASFFAPNVVIEEMPNRFAPRGSKSDLRQALQNAVRGLRLFRRQTYTITNALAEGDSVALQLEWIGVSALPIQGLPAGTEIRDHVAVFLTFDRGRIVRQRVYDCFESPYVHNTGSL